MSMPRRKEERSSLMRSGWVHQSRVEAAVERVRESLRGVDAARWRARNVVAVSYAVSKESSLAIRLVFISAARYPTKRPIKELRLGIWRWARLGALITDDRDESTRSGLMIVSGDVHVRTARKT